MKIQLDQHIELELDLWTLEKASERIDDVRRQHPEKADGVLRGILTLLLFGQIEQQRPGTLERLMNESARVAETLDGLKPQTEENQN